MNDTWETRNTLLRSALDRNNDSAWEEFTAFYYPFIIYLLKRIQIPAPDLEDVSQEVLITLWRKLDRYAKEKGKFRSWLSTVIRNTAYDYFDRTQRDRSLQKAIQTKEIQHEQAQFSEPDLAQIIDEEWKTHLSNLALQRIADAFGKKSIQCFLDGMHGIPAVETAERLNLAVETIYSSRKRVKARMLREIRHLQQQMEF